MSTSAHPRRVPSHLILAFISGLAAGVALAQPPAAPPGPPAPGSDEDPAVKLRPWAEVAKGYEQVVSTADGKSFYSLWVRKRDGAMLAELPQGWEGQKQFFAMTTPTGEDYAGLQSGDLYVYWKRVENRMVMLEPNIGTRSTGDNESKSAIKDIFTDRVVIDVPVACMGPSGRPVIDMKDLLVGHASTFYGYLAGGTNSRLATLVKAKSFPQNAEITYEMPGWGGSLHQFHYSISLIPDNTGYKPREADERVGFFTTVYRDLGKFRNDEKWIRYVNRWNLEKRDPKLKLSEPKEPIIYYVESTTPVRYRKFVRDAVLRWNKAFEKVGILNAIEVRQQDAETGSYMDLDPEDVRYNFIRWLSNDQGTAIGPSRVHPLTGQILDADVVLTDGWIRYYWMEFNEFMPELAMEGFSPETMAWLDKRPQWDPRIRMADPAKRDLLLARRAARGVQGYGGHPLALADPDIQHEIGDAHVVGEHELDGLVGRTSQVQGSCRYAQGRALDMGIMRMALDMFSAEELAALEPQVGDAKDEKKDDKKKDEKKEPKYDTLDGVPEWFIGPAIEELVMHEVGHTLGLRHNFKASSVYTWAQIHSPEFRGKKPWAASVMDYNPTDFYVKDGKPQADFSVIDIGPYDFWAIEYGYTSGDTKDVLKRVAEPELAYATDEDTSGPDPLARRYDMAANSIDYANQEMDLARYHRGRLLDKFVKDGQSWARVRRGYDLTLGLQVRALSMTARWVGGAFINRDRKGDPNSRSPIQVVPAELQRTAMKWCIENAFEEKSFGLTPEMLEKMTVDKWMDEGGWHDAISDATYPVHDRIAGIQTAVLTMLMNPTTLRRVYDNEFRIAGDADALTLPEMLDAVTNEIWKEVLDMPSGRFTPRKPMISSLRRNLQTEHLARLIDLTFPDAGFGEAYKPIANLSVATLRRLQTAIDTASKKNGLDPYTSAHLADAKSRIDRALAAQYIYNAGSMGGMGGFFMFGQTAPAQPPVRGSR